MNKTKKIIFLALMLACNIVLSRFFSIKTPLLVISFSFIPTILVAIMFGLKGSILIAGLGDLIGALLFPFGAFFPGFTFSAIIAGLIYGLILYNKKTLKSDKQLIFRLIISIVIVTLLVNTIMNTYWIYMISKKAFWVLVPTRIVKELIMIPIQVTTMYFLVKALKNNIINWIK